MRTNFFFLIAAMLLTITIGCGGGGGGNPVVPPDGKTFSGCINLPVDTTGSIVLAGTETAMPNNNNFSINLNDGCTQAVFVVKNGNLLGAATVVNTSLTSQNITIDARSTAETLLLLTPFVAQNGVEMNNEVMGMIERLENLSQVESAVKNCLSNKGTVLDSNLDVTLKEAISNAITELFSDSFFRKTSDYDRGLQETFSGWNINPTSASGVSLRNVPEFFPNFSVNLFEVSNNRKRYVDVYDAETGEFEVGLKSVGFSTLYQPCTEKFRIGVIDTSSRKNVTLKVYGPGLGNLPSVGTKDFNRLIKPVVKSLVFDATLPAISIIFGLSGLGNTSPIDSLAELIIKDLGFLEGLSNYILSGNYFAASASVLFKTVDVLVKDAFANGGNSIIIKYLGTNIGFSLFEQALIPLKLFSVFLKGFDIALTIGAYTSSNAVDVFELTIKYDEPNNQQFSDSSMEPINNSGVRATIDVNPNSGECGTPVEITVIFTSGANLIDYIRVYSFGLDDVWNIANFESSANLIKINSSTWHQDGLQYNYGGPGVLRFYAIKSDGTALAVGDINKDGGGLTSPHWNDGVYD